ncbi:MAG: hypothetical protein WAW61_06165 [Methylococcaceae bacterium]
MIYTDTLDALTKPGMQKRFLTGDLISQDLDEFSALNLSRPMGAFNKTAYRIKHELIQVILERESQQPRLAALS